MKNSKILNKKIIFKKGGVRFVHCDIEIKKNVQIQRYSIEHPGCSVILPLIDKDKIVLVKQYRYATRKWLWEIPAGGIEANETPRKAAQRELMEEIGYKAKTLTYLTKFYPTPGISEEVMHLFLAEDLIEKSLPGDIDEHIEVKVFTLKELKAKLQKNQILDGKTQIALYWLLQNKKK